jgi:FlaA1/EpsC-like NDP-sugar epimerase
LRNPLTDSPIQASLLRIPAARVVLLFLFHALVFAVCYKLAWIVRFEGLAVPAWIVPSVDTTLPFIVGTQLLIGALFGFYRGWWRYVGMAEVIRLVVGMSASLAMLIAVWYLVPVVGLPPRSFHPPRGVLLIDWAFALLTLFGARVAIRVGRDRMRTWATPGDVKNVLIVGAGDAGETLAREIEHRPQLGMKVVAFVDDQRAKWGAFVRGIRVCGPISNIAAIAASTRATEVLIAIPSASGKRIREIIHHLSSADLTFKIMPGIDHLVSGKVQVTQLRPVNVEDLLRRKRIELPGDPVRALFAGKRVMVTGAGGTIGSELASQILQFAPEKLVLVERSEFALYEVGKRLGRESGSTRPSISSLLVDIRDTELVDSLLERERPHIVLHAAAHKHVPLGEENPPEYLRNNCLATRTLAELCAAHDVRRFVFISTDKAINPSSVMGATKRAAEIALLDVAREGRMNATVVRFGNVIGSSGSVIPLFMEQIAAGGPVTVTHPDVTRYFLRTSEAVSLVLQAATLGEKGHIFMLDMGEPVKIADLAHDLIRLSNHTVEEIPIVYTGLRPGEKMFEEIRLKGESIRPTIHPQIVVTEAPQPEGPAVGRWLAAVHSDTQVHSQKAMVYLQALVQEYTPFQPEAEKTAPNVVVPSGGSLAVSAVT